MSTRSRIPVSTVPGCAILGAALLFAAPAVAQTTVEELTVTGHGRIEHDTMSYVVGFADLNLKEESGRKELDHRVRVAASYVCRKLNGREVNSNPGCEAQTVKEAMASVRRKEREVQKPGAKLEPGRPWVEPGP
jgi:UrcA family protein